MTFKSFREERSRDPLPIAIRLWREAIALHNAPDARDAAVIVLDILSTGRRWPHYERTPRNKFLNWCDREGLIKRK